MLVSPHRHKAFVPILRDGHRGRHEVRDRSEEATLAARVASRPCALVLGAPTTAIAVAARHGILIKGQMLEHRAIDDSLAFKAGMAVARC